jgi:hypothetical protein
MTEIISSRRSFLTGLGLALVCAPAIVRSTVIMPVKNMLLLPDAIGDITFPIEGMARYSSELNMYGNRYSDFVERPVAEFSHAKWSERSDRPHHSIPLDADHRWERMKARELQRRIIA